MSKFEDIEAEYLAANPQAAAPGYKPSAAAPAATAPDDEPLTGRDLAAAALLAADPHGDPTLKETVWRARVAKAAVDMAAAGNLRASPGAQATSGPEPSAEDWALVNSFAGAKDPRTGRRYYDDPGVSGQRVRELIDAARCDVFAGKPIEPQTLKFARDTLAADLAAYKAEQVKQKASDSG